MESLITSEIELFFFGKKKKHSDITFEYIKYNNYLV